MKKTYDGRNLQKCAVILSIVAALASIALGVVQIVAAADSGDFLQAGGVTGILTLVLGPFAAYVLCLVLRGFGTIVRKYENDEEPKLRNKRSFLDLIGIEDVEENE